MLLSFHIRKFIAFEKVTVLYVNGAFSAVAHYAPYLLVPVEIVEVGNMAKGLIVVWVVVNADLQVQNLELFPYLFMGLEIESYHHPIRQLYFYREFQ